MSIEFRVNLVYLVRLSLKIQQIYSIVHDSNKLKTKYWIILIKPKIRQKWRNTKEGKMDRHRLSTDQQIAGHGAGD